MLATRDPKHTSTTNVGGRRQGEPYPEARFPGQTIFSSSSRPTLSLEGRQRTVTRRGPALQGHPQLYFQAGRDEPYGYSGGVHLLEFCVVTVTQNSSSPHLSESTFDDSTFGLFYKNIIE